MGLTLKWYEKDQTNEQILNNNKQREGHLVKGQGKWR